MSKKKVFMDFREEGVYDTFEKHKSLEKAVLSGLESAKRMESLGYQIDYFCVDCEDFKEWHIRITGDRFGKGE